jgi:hypothetical protein
MCRVPIWEKIGVDPEDEDEIEETYVVPLQVIRHVI